MKILNEIIKAFGIGNIQAHYLMSNGRLPGKPMVKPPNKIVKKFNEQDLRQEFNNQLTGETIQNFNRMLANININNKEALNICENELSCAQINKEGNIVIIDLCEESMIVKYYLDELRKRLG